ncbi:protein ILITYHIA [Primulina huaijiensis]|uniref:protein ILITYHIA n=1 Tax=Primulina huaijiensis TaxID=1492673 RepID=UPI003CC73918
MSRQRFKFSRGLWLWGNYQLAIHCKEGGQPVPYARNGVVRAESKRRIMIIYWITDKILPHHTQSVVGAAEVVWDCYRYDFGTDYSGLFKALSHVNYSVRVAAAEALAAAMDENPDTIQESLSTLFSLYIRDVGIPEENIDAGWVGRQGIALALLCAADVLQTKDLPVVMTFLISRALADPNADVRGRMIDAGIMIIDKHGRESVSLLFPIFENYLNKKGFGRRWRSWIQGCVSNVSFSVMINGRPRGKFRAFKGLRQGDSLSPFLFNLVLDVMGRMIDKAKDRNLIRGIEVGRDKIEISHIQFADDTLFFGQTDDHIRFLVQVVNSFCDMSGLKINWEKSALLGIHREQGEVERFALQLGCIKENWPINYLGVPLGGNPLQASFWEPVVAKLVPKGIADSMDKIARNFLWDGEDGDGHIHLVAWEQVCKPKDKGGLGGWKIIFRNKALLGKWWWRFFEEDETLWKKIIVSKYGLQENGWDAGLARNVTFRCPWKFISRLYPTFKQRVTIKVRGGNKVRFWEDRWWGESSFKEKYPALFRLASLYNLPISFFVHFDNVTRNQSWDFHFRRVVRDGEITQLSELLVVLDSVTLVEEVDGFIQWSGDSTGIFSVSSFYESFFPDNPSSEFHLFYPIWKVPVPNKIQLFSWTAALETQDHMLIHCPFSTSLWARALQEMRLVLAALGTNYFENILPDIIRNCSHSKASVRDGYLTLFKYLPRSLNVQFQKYLQLVLPAILDGLADENESVRDAALSAGHVLVQYYATTSLPLLLPAVEDGIFNDNWRIRQSSVELLGDLLFKVAGTSGKALLEGGSDDEGASTEAHGRAIIEVLGREKRNEVLAALYMVRTDVSLTVRQAALHVWKTIVANTPKTLKEIMPVLMNTLIISLASSSSERRQVAGRSLGELVRKLGDRVLPLIVPILSQGLDDPNPRRRQGVCIGLSEVMASAGKSQILTFMDELIPTIRTALCDSVIEVREAAGLAFSTLYKSAGMQAIDEIVPTLLHALEDDQTSDTALDGLKQILSVRTSAVLPHILPKLVQLPLSAFNAHALGALAEVAGAGLSLHLGTVLPALLASMGDDNEDVQHLAKKSAETVVLVIDEEGVESLISELLKGVADNQASIRRSSSYLIGYFFQNSKLYLVDEAPNMISTLIILLSDPDSATVSVSWEALLRVVSSVPKEVLPSYIKLVRDAVSTSRDKERRKKKGGPVLIPGFCLPKALQPVLPLFLQGLVSGSAELREQAALGLGELIEVTSEKALREFVIPITGPLIRIIGDRFPWQVKSAILSTLSIMIQKGGIALKPFLPQLQTTFIKCLQDNTRTVRSSAALALGKLSALSTRIDPLVGDLLSGLQASEPAIREAILTALEGVIKNAGKSLSSVVVTRVHALLKDMIYNEDDQIRNSSAIILGILSQYLDNAQISEVLKEVADSVSSSSWITRHGSILAITSMLRHNASVIYGSPLLPNIVDCLKSALKDEKFLVRESSVRALGRLLLYQVRIEPSNTSAHLATLTSVVLAMQDDSSEVRRRALSTVKTVSKANPQAVIIHTSLFGPVLAECLKDGSTPVRLAAERCALHSFQLVKGTENLQAAQKYITGLDARRISKLPEYSDDSEDEPTSSE